MTAYAESIPSAPFGTVETGVPAFVVLGPEAIGLSTPPTDLKLLPDGRILVVSQHEIAFGDGVRWEVFHGQEIIYNQVAVAQDGRIYTGVEGKIARIDLGEDAQWRLTPAVTLPAYDANIRTSTMVAVDMVSDQWFWHANSGAIIAWQPGQTTRIVGNISSIERIFTLGQDVFVSEQSSGGLFRLEVTEGSAKRVESVERLASETVTSSVAFGPGQLLVGTSLAGLKLFDGESFQPFQVSGILNRSHRINDLCSVGEGLFAAAVDTIGIVIFDRQGRTVQVLDRSLDHRLSRVLRLQYAPDGVLWALLNEGVVRMEFPSPFSHIEPLIASGLTYAKPLRHDGELWILADGRAMRGIYGSDRRLERFEPDNPPGHFIFSLDDIEGQLFAGTDEGIFVYENAAWKIAGAGIVNARIATTHSSAAGLLYVGRGEFGYLQKTANGFTTRRIPVPGLGDNFNAMEDAEGIVWLELGTSRLARLDPHPEQPTIQILDAKDGLTDGWVEIYQLNGIARFHLPSHVFRFDKLRKKFVEDTELIGRFPQFAAAGGRPLADSLGRIWYTADGTTHVIETKGPRAGTVRTIASGFGPTHYIVEDSGDIIWMFENRRLVRMDLRVSPPPPRPLQALVTSIQFSVSGRRFFPGKTPLAPIEYGDNSLVFHFSAPANPFGSPVTFEVQLEGAGNQWVSTGTVGSAAFNRLKEGQYIFRVRPMAKGGSPGAEARLEFTVRPPWFRTTLAWFIYVAATVGFIGFAAWFPSFLQRRENERLERVVAERTKELNTTNTQLERQIEESTEKSVALSASEERFRTLNTELERRVHERTAELSLSNDELQQRELLFRLIFEHAPVGISWKRADLGDVYHFNPTFRRILDLADNTLIDYARLATLVHPDDAARQVEMNQLIGSGQADSYNLEERFVLKDSVTVWGSLSVAVIRDRTGRIIQEIGILEDISARKQAESDLASTYQDLVTASRMAGMAEVATGVLHNVGNVLNSVNVSSNVIATGMRQFKAATLVRLSTLLDEHTADLGEFLTQDPKGKRVPELIASLARHFEEERTRLVQEVESLQKNIDHIKEIVAMQQAHATVVAIVEPLDAAAMMEDALQMNSASLSRGDIKLVREFQPTPPVLVEKGKVLQILVNLIRNAKHACNDHQPDDDVEKTIIVSVEAGPPGFVRLIVRDNGVGIPEENLTRIFGQGFTTRAYGHGFGLHSSALAAKQLKGSLSAQSEGPGKGATFILDLPVAVLRAPSGEIAQTQPAELATANG